MIHRLAALLLLLLLPAFNVACTGYGAPSEVINGTAVVTIEAQSPPDFKQFTTFTITPTIQVQDDTSDVPRSYERDASSIIPQIQNNMVKRGYTYVESRPPPAPPPTPQPHLVIALYAYLGSQAYGGVYCNWYYWGYPYGCYPTWGYYGTYNYGTLVMEMGDYKNLPTPPPSGTQVPLIWNGSVYGVLGTQSYNLQRVLTGIDQAFAQSPYISKQ